MLLEARQSWRCIQWLVNLILAKIDYHILGVLQETSKISAFSFLSSWNFIYVLKMLPQDLCTLSVHKCGIHTATILFCVYCADRHARSLDDLFQVMWWLKKRRSMFKIRIWFIWGVNLPVPTRLYDKNTNAPLLKSWTNCDKLHLSFRFSDPIAPDFCQTSWIRNSRQHEVCFGVPKSFLKSLLHGRNLNQSFPGPPRPDSSPSADPVRLLLVLWNNFRGGTR